VQNLADHSPAAPPRQGAQLTKNATLPPVKIARFSRKNLLFLKKKKQKDFYHARFGAFGCTEPRPKHTKVFCSFSSEKETLTYF